MNTVTAHYIGTDVICMLVGPDLTLHSTSDPVLVPSLAGNVPFIVALRDPSGQPVAGNHHYNVWLDLTEADDIFACGAAPRIVYPNGPSDAEGRIRFNVTAAGCSSHPAKVMTPTGMISSVPIRPLDRGGDLMTTELDFHGDICNDFDGDNDVDNDDYDFFARYRGQSCSSGIPNASNYVTFDVYSSPPPERIYQGETIQICARTINTIDSAAVLDSMIIEHSGWGIAQSWTPLQKYYSVPLAGADTSTVCASFFVPPVGHGCFRSTVYVRYPQKDNAVVNKRWADSDSVVYYVQNVAGRQWAVISLSSGQELMACPIDTAGTEVLEESRVYGMTMEQVRDLAGLRNQDLIDLVVSAPGAEAAMLWEGEFPQFTGSDEERAVLERMSTWLFLVRSVVINNRDTGKILNCLNLTNGCGNAGVFAWYIPLPGAIVPDLQFTDCCNQHDLCYRGFGVSECNYDSKVFCDAAFRRCMKQRCDDVFPGTSIRRYRCYSFADFYFEMVDIFGENDCCCVMHPCNKGCPCNEALCPGCTPREKKTDQFNVNPKAAQVASKLAWANNALTSLVVQGDYATTRTLVPIGTAEGGQVSLHITSLLPDGWSYSISDSGIVSTPDTVTVEVRYPAILNCNERGRVIVTGNAGGEYAGEAIIDIYPWGTRGDVDANGDVNAPDLEALVDYCYRGGAGPDPIEVGDVSEDRRIDIADITLFSSYLNGGGVDVRTCGDGPGSVADTLAQAEAVWDSTATIVQMNADIDLRGMEFELRGTQGSVPVSLLPESVEMVYGWEYDLLRVAFWDAEGVGTIYNSGQGTTAVLAIQSECAIVAARAADGLHRSCPVGAGDAPVPVMLTRFDANSEVLGISVRWATVSPEIAGFILDRQLELSTEWQRLTSEPIPASLAQLPDEGYAFADESVVAGATYTYRLSAVDRSNSQFILGYITIEFSPPRPLVLDISQNYPNPFNPSTRFTVAVPSAQELSIRVFDLSGRLVREIYQGEMEVGYHVIGWDGMDERGQRAAAGAYFCNLRGATLNKSVKMLLLK